jgi:hypothetical protein
MKVGAVLLLLVCPIQLSEEADVEALLMDEALVGVTSLLLAEEAEEEGLAIGVA